MPDHQILASEIHADMIKAGWWKQDSLDPPMTLPRNIGELICLQHSELSEAYEGFKLHLKDDHLPEYDMFAVELADTAIRIYDTLGYYALPFEVVHRTSLFDGCSVHQLLLETHLRLSQAMEGFRKNDLIKGCGHLSTALRMVWLMASVQSIPLEEIIEAKREYNRNRLDHKPEVRELEGGKKF